MTESSDDAGGVAAEQGEQDYEETGSRASKGFEDGFGRLRVPCTLTPGCGQLRRTNGALCLSCEAVDFTTAVICPGCNQLTSKLTPTGLPDRECRIFGCTGVACEGASAANDTTEAQRMGRRLAIDVTRDRLGCAPPREGLSATPEIDWYFY